MCTSASVWIRRLLLGKCACMVKGYQNSRQKNTIHNDSNFSPKVCVTKMSYRITFTLASKAWQGHCWICILPNCLVNIITIWRLEHLLTYEKKWEGRSNQLVLEEHPFSYVLDNGINGVFMIRFNKRDWKRAWSPPPPSKKYQNINL